MSYSPGNFHGVITLDGEEIGSFEINPHDIAVKMNKETNDLGDAIEFANENGMGLSLVFQPDFDDHVPQHREELASPK
jgi:hypothetical protein